MAFQRRPVKIINRPDTVEMLVLDGGTFACPARLSAAMKTMPMRSVLEINEDGESYTDTRPDGRTPEGRRYYQWLKRQNYLSAEAWCNDKPFTPEDFTA